MEKFTILTGRAAPLLRQNIDTDIIIPAEWMRSVTADLARAAFAGWRFPGGREDPDFPLNRAGFRDPALLIAGRNFGCGSSRENAIWALQAYGVRCVIAPSFGAIFVENGFKNGLLTIALDEAEVESLAAEAEAVAGTASFTVDLLARRITTPAGVVHRFDVDREQRKNLLEGIDDIDRTLGLADRIAAFQDADRAFRPWSYAPLSARSPGAAELSAGLGEATDSSQSLNAATLIRLARSGG